MSLSIHFGVVKDIASKIKKKKKQIKLRIT